MSRVELVDIGANLLNGQFRDDLDAVLARARGAGLGHMMVTATDIAESAAAIRRQDAGRGWRLGGAATGAGGPRTKVAMPQTDEWAVAGRKN